MTMRNVGVFLAVVFGVLPFMGSNVKAQSASLLEMFNEERARVDQVSFSQNTVLATSALQKAEYLCAYALDPSSGAADQSWDFQQASDVSFTALAEVTARGFTDELSLARQLVADEAQHAMLTSPYVAEIGTARVYCDQEGVYYDVIRYGMSDTLQQTTAAIAKNSLRVGAWVVNKQAPLVEPIIVNEESTTSLVLVDTTKEAASFIGQVLSSLQESVEDESVLAPESTRVPKRPTKPLGLSDN